MTLHIASHQIYGHFYTDGFFNKFRVSAHDDLSDVLHDAAQVI